MAGVQSWILCVYISVLLQSTQLQIMGLTSDNWCEKGHKCEHVCVDSYTGYYCKCHTGYSIVESTGRRCTDCHKQLDVGIILHGDFNDLLDFANFSHLLSQPSSTKTKNEDVLLSVFTQVTVAKRNVQVAVVGDSNIINDIKPDYTLFLKNRTLLRQELHQSLTQHKATCHISCTLGAKLDYMTMAFLSQDTGNRYFAPNLVVVFMLCPHTGERPSQAGAEAPAGESWAEVVDKASLLEATGVHIAIVCVTVSNLEEALVEVKPLKDIASDEQSIIQVMVDDRQSVEDMYSTIRKLMVDTMASYCYETWTKCFLTEDSKLMCACVTSTEGAYPLNGSHCVKEQSASRQAYIAESKDFTESLLQVAWILTLTNSVLVVLIWMYVQIYRRHM